MLHDSNKIIIICTVFFSAVIVYCLAKNEYKSDDIPQLHEVRANFTKLDEKYGTIPLREGDSAYTENKEVITLCLKSPDTGEYYDMNTVMYVALHELAHVVSKGKGHGEEFKKNFMELLRRGALMGFYDPSKRLPSNYCGTTT